MFARSKLALTAAALFSVAPGVAHASDGLDCMAQSYDSEQLSEIKSLSVGISFSDDAYNEKGQALSQLIIEATRACSEQNSWTDIAGDSALAFELGRVFEAAYRQSDNLTLEQIALVDAALAKGDQSQVWDLMERMAITWITHEEPEFTAEDDRHLSEFFMGAGLDDVAAAGKVSELMLMMALARVGRRDFEANWE